ncbi:MAG: hypothetical protein IKA64_02020 [Clostridia bacterium]|nr:hypothetical protein [Clostridia bacterium]
MPENYKEQYMRAYMDGYTAAIEKLKREGTGEPPYIDAAGIMERYRVGEKKAHEIIRAVRYCCGGGMLGASGKVKMAELLYWESLVDKTKVTRL